MFTPEKIEEWLKEVEERPASAGLIIQFVGNRLRDLAERNQALTAENIALMTDKRVEEYEQRIAHLEYQLDLLKRQLGGDLSAALEAAGSAPGAPGKPSAQMSLVIYHPSGRALRLTAGPPRQGEPLRLGRLVGELIVNGEPPRLLGVSTSDELLFVFSSGRVTALPASSLPVGRPADAPGVDEPALDWANAPLPEEPRAGESLVCIAPIARIALAEYLLQASRRGYVKKIRAQMTQSILANHYIGSGVKISTDRTFALALSGKDDRLALVTKEGYLQCLDVLRLPFSVEQALNLGATDHLVAAFPIAGAGSEHSQAEPRSVVVMTQLGKAVHWLESDIETAASTKVRGQAVFSAQRRGQGTRVVGAAALRPDDWLAGLDNGGDLWLYPAKDLLDRGTLPVQGELLAFAAFPAPARKARGK